MIEIKNLSRSYHETFVLCDLSFTVAPFGVHGILGPDCSGKSTLMNILAGADTCFSGSVRVGETQVAEDPLALRRNVGYLPEKPALYGDMTVFEFLTFVGETKHVPTEKLFRQIKSAMELTGLEDYSDRLIRKLNSAQRQRVGITMTLLGNPALILLDEPTASLTPDQAKEIRALIRKLGGVKTVIVCSRSLQEIRELCDDVILLSEGEILARDTVENLEKKLSKSSILQMTVRGNRLLVTDALEKVTSITSCNILATEDAAEFYLRLEYDGAEAPIEQATDALTQAGFSVMDAKIVPLTLADFYAKLVADAEEKADERHRFSDFANKKTKRKGKRK